MQLKKVTDSLITEELIDEDVLNEADYGKILDKEFKSYIVRIGKKADPSPYVKQTDDNGNPLADTVYKSFDDALSQAKKVSSGGGIIFKRKNDKSIAFIKFSKKEIDDTMQTAFDSTNSTCLCFMDGKLTPKSKEDLDALYTDLKQRQKAGVSIEDPEIAKSKQQYVIDKAAADKAERENAEKEEAAKKAYEDAIKKIKAFEKQLCYFCPDTGAPITKEKEENPYFYIQSPQEDKAVKINFTIENGKVKYQKLSLLARDKKNEWTELAAISTADGNDEDAESKIISNVKTWQLRDENATMFQTKAPAKKAAPKASAEKKEVEIINSQNNKLNVKKGDYAVGTNGKLKLVTVDQLDYETKPDGKAFRGLRLSKNVVDALKKVGVMESYRLNEADTKYTKLLDANKIIAFNDGINKAHEEINKCVNAGNDLASGGNDEKKKQSLDTAEEIKTLVDDLEKKVEAAIEKADKISAAELSDLDATEYKDLNDTFFDSDGGCSALIEHVAKALTDANNSLGENNDWNALNSALSGILVDAKSKYKLIDGLVEKCIDKYENKTLRGIVQNDEKKAEKSDNLSQAKSALGDPITLPKNIQEILGKRSFEIEVDNYGAEIDKNPFLQFLLLLKNTYKNIGNNINYGQYGVIHDGVVDRKIPLKELQTGVDQKLQQTSMLVMSSFYEASIGDEQEYLEYREKLWRTISSYSDPLDPVAPGADIDGFTIPAAGSRMSASIAYDIMVKDGKLRSLDNLKKIGEQLFGDTLKTKKSLATTPDEILKEIAKQLSCQVDELGNHKEELTLAMKILLNRVYFTIPLKLESVQKYAKELGIPNEEIFKGLEKDQDSRWRNFFDSDNIDNVSIVGRYVSAVKPFLNKEADKNADNAK